MDKTFNHEFVSLPELLTESIDGKRYYVGTNGNKLPSVTSILGTIYGGWVHEWRAKVGEEVANKISQQAATRGTAIHKLCEEYILNKPDYLKGHVPVNIEMFSKMKKELHRINNVYAIEAPLFSEKTRCAGRVDCIAQFDGYPSIIDYKTSRRIKTKEDIESYFVQMTLYSLMFEDMTNIKCKQLVVIMGVDHEDPLVFIADRKEYITKAAEAISNYYKLQERKL
jgi:hypothetical protein